MGFSLSLTNSKPQGLFALRAFDSGALRLRYALLGADEGVYIYALCAADPSPLAEKLVDMFSAAEKRLGAVGGWAAARLVEGLK